MKKPELLSPAGSLKSMRYAFAYGADAVYAGLPRYSLRARNNSFKKDVLAEGIAEARSQGKKFYVTANLFPHNAKVKTFLIDIEPVADMKPDALIMADPGLIMMARERWPEIPVHLSVQMNTVNAASVKFWQREGISRIILSRELSLNEIAEIRQQCPDIELEVFVHGAICMAHSGRCLLSGYLNHRDSNQGVCTNACRWKYKAYFLEEKNRPGEMLPVTEDEHGTYIMNSKDLRAIEHVQRLVEIGVDCLKIEGRTKSHYYAARTAQAYRQAIDCAYVGRELDPALVTALENLSNRGYTDGFFKRHRSDEYQNYLNGSSRNTRQEFVGEAVGTDGEWITVDVKNKFQVGDRLEFILPDGKNREVLLTRMEDMKGTPIDTAPGDGHTVRIPSEGICSPMILISRFL
ncbi:MAG: U32 family peptidase [Alphaproteobacteria bacterium]|nr:U32 family peptidase [Alphaproteobacteria bacterium]